MNNKNVKIIIRIISIICLMLTFIAIFYFSNQTVEESAGLSSKVTLAIVRIFSKNKSEIIENKNLINNIEFIIRKLAHFTIYSLVGLFCMTCLFTFNIKFAKKNLLSILIGGFYAISDEIHQSFVPR